VDGPARLRPTKSSFRANSASVHVDTAASGFGSSKSGRGVPLTKQEKPRAARPTEPRDSYASGIRIPHSSPSHEATHTWLSGSISRQASPSARNEEKHGSVPKIHTCLGPDSHNEQTPALKVPLQTELRFHLRRYEQPPTIGGSAEQQKADGWLAAARSSSSDDDFCSERLNSSSDDLRADAAAIRPSPTSPLEGRGRAEGRRVGGQSAVRGWHRLSRQRRNLFRLPRRKVAPEAAPKPLRPKSRTRGSCQRHERRTPFPPDR
jgi:hypothetical protein